MVPSSWSGVSVKLPAKRIARGREIRQHSAPSGVWTGAWSDLLDAPAGRIEVPPAHHLIHFLLDGRVSLRVSGAGLDRVVRAGPGSITIIPTGGRYAFLSDGPSRSVICSIDPDEMIALVAPELAGAAAEFAILTHVGIADSQLWYFGEALSRELADPEHMANSLYVQSLHIGLTIQLLRRYTPLGRRSGSRCALATRLTNDRQARAKAYIEEHLADGSSLDAVAAAVGVSPFHFARMFKASVGLTPHQYRTQARVDRAKQLLEPGGLSLVQVALDVGFSSQSHLTAVFRKAVGLTPAVYRRRCGQAARGGQTGTV